jgi:hypothetical protein
VLSPLANEVESVADSVGEVERFDGTVKEVGDEAVERGPHCGCVLGAEEQGAELLEAEEEGVDEAARPGKGEDVIGRSSEEFGEELGSAALEGIGGIVGPRRREGVDLVPVPAERPAKLLVINNSFVGAVLLSEPPLKIIDLQRRLTKNNRP